jgi:outer membrane protein assembly factor BamB
MRRIVCCISLVFVILLAACGSTTTQSSSTPKQQFVLIGNTISDWNQDTGAMLWSIQVPSPSFQPVYTRNGNRLYVADGTMMAIDIRKGNILWKVQLAGMSQVSSLAIVDNGRLLVMNTTVAVYALNANDGTVVWQVVHPYLMPALAVSPDQSSIYVNMPDVVSLSATTGIQQWKRTIPNGAYSQQATRELRIEGDMLLALTQEQDIVSLDKATGAILWDYHASTGLSDPYIHSNNIYFSGQQLLNGVASRQMSALDITTGKLVWTQSEPLVDSSSMSFNGIPPPVATNDTVAMLAGSDLYGMDLRTGQILWQQLNAGNGQLIGSDQTLYQISQGILVAWSSTGDIIWKTSLTTAAIASGYVHAKWILGMTLIGTLSLIDN